MFDTSLSALTAAGGNSRAARSMRARLQWRDRFGRWIEMGRGVKFKVRGADGASRSVIGSFVGAKDANTGQVYVSKDPNGLPDGFYDVHSANAQEFVANLSEQQLGERGIAIGRDVDGRAVGERVKEDIPNSNEMKVAAAPEGWEAIPGTFGGKKVIQTDDGDFRVHFGGKDETVLLEDHRANPGQADPQRSVGEAFKKVNDVDIQREEGGDTAYTGLSEGNDEKLASLDRDQKIEQIKFNERTINNEKAGLTARQQATTNNETLKKELADSGAPYDPENGDTDEALAARKANPAAANANTPTATTAGIDTTTFEVSPEGFLVPTGKITNDITPEGLANFMTAEKEHLGKGGARLVVDTDSGTAEIHNSADTVEDAKAQAGGLGQDTVLDLSSGQPVQVSEGAVDPNSADVNPNLDGDTSANAPTGGAPNAEDRDPNAVEPRADDAGADAPVRPESDAEAGRPAADSRPVTDSPDTEPTAERGGDDAGASSRPDSNNAEDGPSTPASAPGSVEELKDRRAKVQTALDNAGDPKDIIALNEQADALDNRIAAKDSAPAPETPEADAPERPNAGDIGNRMTENERSREEALRLINESEGDPLALNDDDYKRLEALATEQERKQDVLEKTLERLQSDVIPSLEKDYEGLRAQLDEANGVQELDFEADRSAPDAPEVPAEPTVAEKLEAAWLASDPFPDSAIDRRERAALRILRDGEKKGDLEKAKARLSQDEQDALSDEIAEAVGIERVREVTPEVPAAPERPAYQEPGDADAVSAARAEIADIDAEIETQLNAAEAATDPQIQAEHLSRVRTLERQRKIQDNALNRALGNAPMDLNGDLGWNMNKPENRGSLPEAPVAPENSPELPGLPDERADAPEAPEGGAPAVLDPEMDTPEVDSNEVLRKKLQNEPLTPEEQREFDAMQAADAADKARPIEERVAEAQAAYDAAEKNLRDMLLADEFDDAEVDKAETLMDWAKVDLDEVLLEKSYADAARTEQADLASAPDAPETPGQTAERILASATENAEIIDGIDASEASGVFKKSDDPNRVSSGHENGINAAKAKMQGKDFTPEEQQAISDALDSQSLSDNQLSELNRLIDSAPNKANTTTVARPANEQPEFMSRADVEIINAERDDPNFVFDEDLTWRKILEENPDAVQMDNGDLLLETTTKTTGTSGTKKYELLVRRTAKNRFMTYIIETDGNGNRRAKRVGNTEWHSYEALENKDIARGRKLVNGKRPSSFFANNTSSPTEQLGVRAFPEDDFLGDIGNPNAPIPATGDERYDHLLEAVATHIRNGDADIHDIEAHLRSIDPENKGAIQTIMNAVIGRAQDNYRPDGVNPWQTYDGETAEIGGFYDWTDWHEEKDWWLPNGQLNPNKRPNPNLGKVERVQVMGFVEENTDGKGHTYGDHVWVKIQRPDGSWSNWTKRSAQTLRRADEGSAPGDPFFSKREEWRTDPEALARRFRVPNAVPDEPVVTKERPRRDLPQSRRTRFTPRGSLPGYTNVPVPDSPAAIAGLIERGEVRPQIRPARDARPGMMIVRMDDDGNQFVDSIIRVESLGDGGYRIQAARPDGNGFADVDSFVVPGDAEIAIWTAPGIDRSPEASEPKNLRRGETVEFDRNGQVEQGVVAFDDDNGHLTVVTPGNETIDILESNIRPATYQDITKEERTDVIESLDSTDLPPLIRDLIMRGILDPGLSRLRYEQILETLSSFSSKSPRISEIDSLLDMIGVSDQLRADVRDFLDTDPTD